MSKVEHLFPDPGRGTLGPLIVYKMFGNSYYRIKPDKYHDKKSDDQLKQRSKFTISREFIRPFKDVIRKTYANEAKERRCAAFQACHSHMLRHAIVEQDGAITIDIDQALLSKGPLSVPKEASIEFLPDGIQFKWDTAYDGEGDEYDTLAIICQLTGENESLIQFTGVPRCEGEFFWKSSAYFPNYKTNIWIAFRSEDETLMSNSKCLSFYLSQD
ncbi:hypothetical protein EYV94_03970 [Puteibacter caeruleilacunae]|nr:hypothetical protein EYV94_03970 [Puteibacter caeruleilacunae]